VESASCRYPTSKKDGIEDAALTLLGRIPQCGKQQGLEFSLEDTEAAGDLKEYPEQLFEKDEQAYLFASLFSPLMEEEPDVQVPEQFSLLLKNGIRLIPEERLLLKLLYQDNVGVARAGLLLGLNRDQVNGRVRRLLARLRKNFQNMGLEEELLELLR